MIDDMRRPETNFGTGSSDSWCAGFAPETLAVVSAKGWRSPEEAVRSYLHLERRIGGDRWVAPAPDAPEEERTRFWDRLGRPETPDGYRLTPPADGFPYDQAHAAWFRDTAHRIGLTGDQAGALHDAFLDRRRECGVGAGEAEAGDVETGDVGVGDMVAPDSLTQVRQAWGRSFPTRMAEARRTLSAYVVEDAELGAIADKIGDVALMNLLAKIGRSLGEDSLVGGRATGDIGGPDIRAEIRRVQAEAQSDPRHPYLDKTHPEHAAAVRRMQGLFERVHGNRD